MAYCAGLFQTFKINRIMFSILVCILLGVATLTLFFIGIECALIFMRRRDFEDKSPFYIALMLFAGAGGSAVILFNCLKALSDEVAMYIQIAMFILLFIIWLYFCLAFYRACVNK